MRDQESSDIIAALAIGAVIGIGAALLMRGGEMSRREKLMRELKPYRKKAQRGMRTAQEVTRETVGRGRDHLGRGVDAGADIAADLRDSGRAVVNDLRDELAALVSAAGDELRRTAKRTVRQTRRSIRELR